MMHDYLTVKEIASLIQELGFKAIIKENENGSAIDSASSGKEWAIVFDGTDPFFRAISLRIIIWVTENPLEWTNNWNSTNYLSVAHVIMPDGESTPTPDIEGDYMVMISCAYEFEGGVTLRYLEQGLLKWMATVEELSDRDDIKMVSARNPTSY